MSIFSSIPVRKPKRSTFNLSHEKKMSVQFGRLVPIFVKEVVPGDKFNLQTNFLIRFAPLIAPIMHNIDIFVHYFYVPNRILSQCWEQWITAGETGTNPNFSPPRFTFFNGSNELLTQVTLPGNLADYLGMSTSFSTQYTGRTITNSCLPFMAYHSIWLNYYRDENLNPLPNTISSDGRVQDWKYYNHYYDSGLFSDPGAFFNGSTSAGNSLGLKWTLREANFVHDYFTSALPWSQRGPSISAPIDSMLNNVPVTKIPSNRNAVIFKSNLDGTSVTGTPSFSGGALMSNGNVPTNFDPNGTLVADIEGAQLGLNIVDLRRTARLQEWQEKNARGGNRLKENIYNHFGVTVPDARLQRPEFLGGGRVPVAIEEVLQTSQTTDTSPQANQSGNAKSAGSVGFRNKFFSEHGFIMGIMSIMPRPGYQQGTDRMFRRNSRFDYYWPEFAHIGEQEVYNWELLDDYTSSPSPSSADNNGTFGYNPRYSEYKFAQNTTHGDFKTTLSFWHMNRIFNSRPVLNESFLHLGSDYQRVFAVQDSQSNQKVWCWIYHKCYARRPMPKFGVPML